MYLTRDNINSLNGIILNLNSIESEEEKKKFLDEHVEDSVLLLNTLKKLNKSKIPKSHIKPQKNSMEVIESNLYKEDEVYSIFSQKSDEAILAEYSLINLKHMYISVYNRNPASSYTKERIVSTLRSRLHTMNRAAAFMKMAEDREKQKE